MIPDQSQYPQLLPKLIGKVYPEIWRIIHAAYKVTKIQVKVNGEISESIETTDGLRQGSPISPGLFNFFINDLIIEIINKDLGCKIGTKNVSILAFCDDIFLMTKMKDEMETILTIVTKYAEDWKIVFNALKLHIVEFNRRHKNNFRIGKDIITHANSVIYLGLPINKSGNSELYFGEKFSKMEGAFFGLRSLGCNNSIVSPRAFSIYFKSYCQSIVTYGMEMLTISPKKLIEYNRKQNNLIKMNFRLGKFSRHSKLLKALKIRTIEHIYGRSKIFFINQIKKSNLTSYIINYLSDQVTYKPAKTSILFQIKDMEKKYGINRNKDIKENLDILENHFVLSEDNKINNILAKLNFRVSNQQHRSNELLEELKKMLRYEPQQNSQ